MVKRWAGRSWSKTSHTRRERGVELAKTFVKNVAGPALRSSLRGAKLVKEIVVRSVADRGSNPRVSNNIHKIAD